ncbi:MAG: hypothetical protein J0L83_03600 [Chitinophagales bacterium]|nr:hypothetical protein [Chitinophagales bacterium]
MKKRLAFHFILILAIAFVNYSSVAQKNAELLSFGVTGSIEKTPDEKNPLRLLKNRQIQLFLLTLSKSPLTLNKALSNTKSQGIEIKNLVDAGLITVRNDTCFLNFTLLNERDLSLLHQVSNRYAKSLTALILRDSVFYDSLLKNEKYPPHLQKDALFILIGCFALDWDGLTITDKMGYRTAASENLYGDRYLLWGKVNSSKNSIRGLYWGSHNDYLNDVVFTSFGDHYTNPRYALPDMKWKYKIDYNNNHFPTEMKSSFQDMANVYFDSAFYNAGKIMFCLYSNPLSQQEITEQFSFTGLSQALKFFTSVRYVRIDSSTNKYHLAIPVFTESNGQMISALRLHIKHKLQAWLNSNYASIKSDLKTLSCMQHGIDYKIAFTEVWHFLFGYTNKFLCEAGFFVNPESPERFHKGYMPVIWHSEVYKEVNF